jgi:F0F1-type ATP synthase membrane subunit b/b'
LNSAVTVAQDSELRREIKRTVIKETKLLDSLGTAQMHQELERKVVSLTEAITEQTGIKPSLSADEAKHYVDDVLKEIKRER